MLNARRYVSGSCANSIANHFRNCSFGDPSFRAAIVNAVLEHLLEDPEIAQFFENWKAEPTLKQAYDLAMEWGTRKPVDPQS